LIYCTSKGKHKCTVNKGASIKDVSTKGSREEGGSAESRRPQKMVFFSKFKRKIPKFIISNGIFLKIEEKYFNFFQFR
jgi:hypothetical protein